MRYQVIHETSYKYETPVVLSQQLLHLTPRVLPWQQREQHQIGIHPEPAEMSSREDYFGNLVTQILLAAPHAALTVRDLTRRIHADFKFDPKATSVSTPLREVLTKRHGVCQDFAHLMIGCLRSLGLAARYVSGYILTTPPPGRPRLVGADASHAWVSAYCGAAGWVELDPTNDCVVGDAHITLAWGRDFSDVTPMRGVILGGGDQELAIRVTVTPQPGR